MPYTPKFLREMGGGAAPDGSIAGRQKSAGVPLLVYAVFFFARARVTLAVAFFDTAMKFQPIDQGDDEPDEPVLKALLTLRAREAGLVRGGAV